MEWKEVVTFAIAAIGAALGIMNTWNSISARRVRLRLRTLHSMIIPSYEMRFNIEVVNFSQFPVTLEEIGFVLDGNRRYVVRYPNPTDGKGWPRRIESRESVSVMIEPDDLRPEASEIRAAYVRTACGEMKKRRTDLVRRALASPKGRT